ncbi:hypothetical protein OPQ81_001027 [Rhizoctonia solani]|nr:hypothetical protein OPQ81_001027 [Rhizoctonia solani]
MPTLSAVEFALCVLSMFGQVIDENRMAVHVLLEAIKSYNLLTKQFGQRAVKQAGYGGRSSLRALAAYLGKDYKMKELRTDEGAQAVLHTILDPVIGSLSRQELCKLRKDVDQAIRLVSSVPVEEVRARMAGFTVQAWEDGRREHWMAVWKKGMDAQVRGSIDASQAEDLDTEHDSQSISTLTAVELPCELAIVPVMSTLKRRSRVLINRRSTSFPSPVDVCLGRRSLSTSEEWYMDKTPVWHPHGSKAFYSTTASNCEKSSLMDFKFPPAGMISSTGSDSTSAATLVDPERALEMSAKLKQWEDEWEKEQLGIWRAAINMDNALWLIMECTRDMKIWHPHGWKKFDGSARSAYKNTGFRFPAPGSIVLPPLPTVTGAVDSDLERSPNVDAKYREWEDSWEAEQLAKWSAGLNIRVKREEGGLWSRLAMSWKSERVDLWAGMIEEADYMKDMDATTPTTLATKLGRLFGLA